MPILSMTNEELEALNDGVEALIQERRSWEAFVLRNTEIEKKKPGVLEALESVQKKLGSLRPDKHLGTTTVVEIQTTPQIAAIVRVAVLGRRLALDMEADKHRDQPELMEVQVLLAMEAAEGLWGVKFE